MLMPPPCPPYTCIQSHIRARQDTWRCHHVLPVTILLIEVDLGRSLTDPTANLRHPRETGYSTSGSFLEVDRRVVELNLIAPPIPRQMNRDRDSRRMWDGLTEGTDKRTDGQRHCEAASAGTRGWIWCQEIRDWHCRLCVALEWAPSGGTAVLNGHRWGKPKWWEWRLVIKALIVRL